MSRKYRKLSEMNYIHDVTFICTLFGCFVLVVHNHCSKTKFQNKKLIIVNDCKNTCDTATQTPNENIPYSNFMFKIEPIHTSSINFAIKNNDEHVKYILTILVPQKHDGHRLKAIEERSRWGICECVFHNIIIVDHHDTRKNTHALRVIEGNVASTISMFDFIIKYSTEWPIHHCGNGDGCRFMIVNGKFFLLGISLYCINDQYKDQITRTFLNRLKQFIPV